MSHNLTRKLTWASHLLCVAIALWWPRLWYDPVYTPRQARLSGQELHLPGGKVPHTQDEQAMAIFWEWQQRRLVTTEWGADSFRGVRDLQGRFQTWLMICLVFGVSRILLYFLPRKGPASLIQVPRRTGALAVLISPVCGIFFARSRPTALSGS